MCGAGHEHTPAWGALSITYNEAALRLLGQLDRHSQPCPSSLSWPVKVEGWGQPGWTKRVWGACAGDVSVGRNLPYPVLRAARTTAAGIVKTHLRTIILQIWDTHFKSPCLTPQSGGGEVHNLHLTAVFISRLHGASHPAYMNSISEQAPCPPPAGVLHVRAKAFRSGQRLAGKVGGCSLCSGKGDPKL